MSISTIRVRLGRLAPLVVGLILIPGLAGLAQEAPKEKAKSKAAARKTASTPLDLNKATAEEMIELLPGVGEVTAKKIVDGRPYKSVDELERAGVPARTIEGIRALVTVAADTPAPSAPAKKAAAKKAATKDEAPATPLDLNKATAEEMIELLPGVGEVTAKKIVDGRPYKSVDELERAGVPARTIEGIRALVTVATATATPAKKKAATAKDAPTAPTGPIDLNTATAAQLETLPGVGPALAAQIVAGRPYKSVDELTRVKGLGEAKVATLKDRVKVGATPDPVPAPSPAPTADASPAPKAKAKVQPKAKAAPEEDDAVAAPKVRPGQRVNINDATQAELEGLLGIGPVKARAIIEARPFETPEDIMKVKGIKERTFAKIKDAISVK